MSTDRSADHVVMDGHVFHCLHCGARYPMHLPAPVDVFVAASDAFVKLHAACIDERVDAELDPNCRQADK